MNSCLRHLRLTILCVLTAWASPRGPATGHSANPVARSADPLYARLINQAMIGVRRDATSPAFRSLTPAGPARILRALRQNGGNSVFILTIYPLRYPQVGCAGLLALEDFYRDHLWGRVGYRAARICLTPARPTFAEYDYFLSGPYSIHVIFGFALPIVHTIILFQGRQIVAIPVHNHFFLISRACTGMRRVQALDSRGHVVYEAPGGRCFDRPPPP